MIDVVCFDVDGVLVDTNVLHAKAWSRALEAIGVEVTPEQYLGEALGLPGADVAALFLPNSNNEERQYIYSLKKIHFSNSLQNLECKVFPDVEELLLDLRRNSYVVAAVSSSSSALAVLDSMGLRQSFDYIVGPQDVPRGKPYPDPYLRALQLSNARIAVAFEDSQFGVESATDAGLFCLAIVRDEGKRPAGAHRYLATGFSIRSAELERWTQEWASLKRSQAEPKDPGAHELLE